MRKLLLIACLGAAASVTSLAATTCSNLTNNTLTAIPSCTWTTSDGAVLTFSNFTLLNNNGSGTVTTTSSNWDLGFTDGGSTFRLNFTPTSAPITATSTVSGSGGGYQFLLIYQIAVTSLGTGGAGTINNIIASLSSSNVTTNGNVQFIKSYGGTASGNVSLVNSSGTNTQSGNSTAGLPTSGPININDFVNVSGGNNGASSATLNSFYNQIGVTTALPEPVSLSLVGVGLLALGLSRKIRR